MKRSKIVLLTLVAVCVSCSGIDNYEAPDGGIYGMITDKITGENLQTEQPDGFTVKLFEKGGSDNAPILIPAKPNGTFENSFIFQNEYRVLPTEGAFFPVDTAVVQVGNRTEVNFEVMPFLAVRNVNVSPSSGKITANYEIVRDRVGDKIIERKTLVSEVPTVNNVVFDFQVQTNLSNTPDSEILEAEYSDEVSGLTSGQDYWVRIAVRTDNALGKYNYSKVFKVTVQ